jgi:hypothetical protein
MDSLGVFGVVIAAIGIVWAVLGLLIPFMIWSIMESSKANKHQLEQLNRRIARLNQ